MLSKILSKPKEDTKTLKSQGLKSEEIKDIITEVGGNRFVTQSIPKYEMPEEELTPRAAYELVHSEMLFDANPRLNMASFVNTWMEDEAKKLITENLDKNFIDKPIYPQTIELQDRCVAMIADLFHAHALNPHNIPVGTATVGSSEAIHLAGLVMKWKWKEWAKGKYPGKPKLIMGSNVQVCWLKFTKYFEVDEVKVPLTQNNLLDIDKVMEHVDECTIGVVGILGNTYSGEYDNIKELNDRIDKFNKNSSWKVPIHVDAASGGFVAPFLPDQKDITWDFRLKWVKSINVSGHKYGLVYPGVGWAIWPHQDDIPKDLIFKIKYLGEEQEDFGLNFSRGGAQIIAQYYNFIRLGKEGYSRIMRNLIEMYKVLVNTFKEMKIELENDTFKPFQLVRQNDIPGLPLVCLTLTPEAKELGLKMEAISHKARERGWVFPVYPMAAPKKDVTVMRMVLREGFNDAMAEKMTEDIQWAVNEVLKYGATTYLDLIEEHATVC